MPQEGRRAIPQWCRASEAQEIRGIKDSKIAETASHLKNATRRSFGKKSEVIRERYASCKRLIIAGRYSKRGCIRSEAAEAESPEVCNNCYGIAGHALLGCGEQCMPHVALHHEGFTHK